MAEALAVRELDGGRTALTLLVDGEEASRVVMQPALLRYGAAVVHTAHIGDVETGEAWRGRGFARRLMTTALARARAGDAAFSWLYGIGDFYHRFGYATLGAGYGLALRHLERDAALPDGWTVRLARPDDLSAIRRLYDADTSAGVMRKVRRPDDPAWKRLAALLRLERPDGERDGGEHDGSERDGDERDECRVVQDPQGAVAAYAWLGRGYWTVDHAHERYWPDDLFIGEVVAGHPAAADAALAACRRWGAEEAARRGRRVGTVRVGASPEGFVAAAGQYQESQATRTSWASAGPQVCTLSAPRLLAQIAPELSRRVAALRAPWQGTAVIHTTEGTAVVRVTADGVSVASGESGPNGASGAQDDPGSAAVPVPLTPQTLIRLVLGGFPPDDLLARTAPDLSSDARSCLLTLFPQRTPYIYPLDH